MVEPVRRSSIFGFEDRVVLDIGSLYIRVGLSGEPRPRHIVPITVPIHNMHLPEMPICGRKMQELYKLWLDSSSEKQTIDILLDHLLAVYSKYLLTDPKQRKVIICENPMLPVRIKEIIATILFEVLQVPSITFMPSSVMALMTSGKLTGLVVDCGHLETTVVPVYDGRPLLHYIETIPLAGEALTHRLKNLIKHHGSLVFDTPPKTRDSQTTTNTAASGPTSPTSPSAGGVTSPSHYPIHDPLLESLSKEVWEDLKVRLCYVGPFPSPKDVSSENREAVFPYREKMLPYTIFDSDASTVVVQVTPHDRIRVPGWVRERAAEVLFEGDDDERSLVNAVLHAVLKCPTDIRQDMIQNICLCGGTSMLPGFHARLTEQLVMHLEEKRQFQQIKRLSTKVKLIRTTFPGNTLSWIGGSLVGALKVGGIEVTLESFLENREIPDWTSLTPFDPTDKK